MLYLLGYAEFSVYHQSFFSKGEISIFSRKNGKEFPNALYYISDSVKGTEAFIENNFSKADIFIAVGGDGTISSIAKN